MKFIKRNKKLVIALGIVLVVLIALAIMVISMFTIGNNDKYGDRLDNIEEHVISDTTIDNINNKIKENTSVTDVNYTVNGKTLNFILKTVVDADLNVLKELTSTTMLEGFSEKELAYYDIQIIINNDNAEATQFPAFGYKHRSNENFSWSNNG